MGSPSSRATQVVRAIRAAADPRKAAFFPRFFRTGKGEYGEGDRFLGVTVPGLRSIARDHRDLPLDQIAALLASPFHEVRLAALLILITQYNRADSAARDRIVRFYLERLAGVNNWDLVDLSAPYILGRHLLDRGDASALDELAGSGSLWPQRIAIVATFAFIRAGEFSHTLRIARSFLDHPHDLIHKAVGWMLREVGKRDQPLLEEFLDEHADSMPRTMLRYAIEKFPEKLRLEYLARGSPRPPRHSCNSISKSLPTSRMNARRSRGA